MRKKIIFPVLMMLCILSWNSCGKGKDVEVRGDSKDILYMGRTHVTPEGYVAFNYPGVTAMLNFEGKRLDMLTSKGSGYYMVEVDGSMARKICVGENDSVACIADSLGDGAHTARITYAMEGFEKKPEIKGFMMPEGSRILPPPQRPELRIEFIGNSMTCGYGTEDPDGKGGFSYDTENHCLTYAYLTGRNLNADVSVVARSGIGMYRNYDGPREGDSLRTMPKEYAYTMLYDPEHPWDFSRFMLDIVCINLGTNDTSTDNYDISIYEREYDKFLTRLRELYPSAKIVLLTGSMLNGKPLEDVKGALDRLAQKHEGTYRFDMSPQTGELGYGADFHPSAAQHAKMAEELTDFLKSIAN